MAGGFTIDKSKFINFEDFIINKFKQLKIDESSIKNLYIDSIITPSALNEDFYTNLNSISPFGPGNTEPKFVIEDVKVVKSSMISNNHIKVI